MGKTYASLDDRLKSFIAAQQLFFVGSAALAADGFVNISPKGLDTLRILDDRTVAYADLTGSGIETVAHLKENGRMVMMFCSFGERPLILRLHGRGEAIEKQSPDFERLRALFPELPAVRAILRLSIERIADSCGWGVPRYEYQGTRDQYFRYAERLGDEGIRKAQLESNMTSVQGLPGLAEPSI